MRSTYTYIVLEKVDQKLIRYRGHKSFEFLDPTPMCEEGFPHTSKHSHTTAGVLQFNSVQLNSDNIYLELALESTDKGLRQTRLTSTSVPIPNPCCYLCACFLLTDDKQRFKKPPSKSGCQSQVQVTTCPPGHLAIN